MTSLSLIKYYLKALMYQPRFQTIIEKNTAIIASTLALAIILFAPVAAYAFSPEAAGDKVLGFITFCLIIVVAAIAGMMLIRSNVAGALVLVLVGIVIYGLLNPGAFQDVARGILEYLGIGGGASSGTGG